jgi:hypothetical protein
MRRRDPPGREDQHLINKYYSLLSSKRVLGGGGVIRTVFFIFGQFGGFVQNFTLILSVMGGQSKLLGDEQFDVEI